MLPSLTPRWLSPYRLCVCGSFCRLAHIAQSTPPSLSSDPMQIFDVAVKECFATCSAMDLTEPAWQHAQLGLRYGGLGLRSWHCMPVLRTLLLLAPRVLQM